MVGWVLLELPLLRTAHQTQTPWVSLIITERSKSTCLTVHYPEFYARDRLQLSRRLVGQILSRGLSLGSATRAQGRYIERMETVSPAHRCDCSIWCKKCAELNSFQLQKHCVKIKLLCPSVKSRTKIVTDSDRNAFFKDACTVLDCGISA
mmetsp:Transcript_16526/g.35001  ORF Transcript_16526/g.35001 Transcript_16526/m.35001 type:complete len:150 (+) Transcript_16526:154-603(+)